MKTTVKRLIKVLLAGVVGYLALVGILVTLIPNPNNAEVTMLDNAGSFALQLPEQLCTFVVQQVTDGAADGSMLVSFDVKCTKGYR